MLIKIGKIKMDIKVFDNLEIGNTNQGEINIKLSVLPINKFIIGVLTTITFICFVFPISLFFFDKLEIGFPIIISFVIFWGTAVYFFKILIWNKFGKEVYSITKDRISFFYDYGFFRSNPTSVKYNKIKFCYQNKEVIKEVVERSDDFPTLKSNIFFILDEDNIISSQLQTKVFNILRIKDIYNRDVRVIESESTEK